jgi:hypothetical protein
MIEMLIALIIPTATRTDSRSSWKLSSLSVWRKEIKEPAKKSSFHDLTPVGIIPIQ